MALVSPDFSGSRYDDNCRIRKIKLRANKRFDMHPFTREDFDASPFAQEEILWMNRREPTLSSKSH